MPRIVARRKFARRWGIIEHSVGGDQRMQFISLFLAIDAMVGGTLMMGSQPVGANITFYNSGATMTTAANAEGKYNLSLLQPGNYDVKVERTVNGRKKTLVYSGLTLV